MTTMPTLETDRLILRKFEEGDAEALLTILEDREVNRFLPWFPLNSLEEAKALLREKYLLFYQKPVGYRYAICLKPDPTPIGYIHLAGPGSYDLGYGLRKELWRRGITPEAGSAVIAQARRDGIPYITATHDRNNPASGAVMRKLGMQYRYSYREQWQPKDISVVFRVYQINLDGQEERLYRKYWNTYPEHFVEPGL